MNFKQLLKTWILLAIGVFIAAQTARGIHYDSASALVVAVLLLSLCNLVLKPLLLIFTLPFIVLTLGIGIWLINALLFMLVGALVEGFHVLSFWNALWGALVVSLTAAAANLLFGGSSVKVRTSRGQGANQGQTSGQTPSRKRKSLDDDDVIDI